MKKLPAFPTNRDHDYGLEIQEARGMTLRDYFAAKAMQSDMVDGISPNEFASTAERAYAMADAMLKAREA